MVQTIGSRRVINLNYKKDPLEPLSDICLVHIQHWWGLVLWRRIINIHLALIIGINFCDRYHLYYPAYININAVLCLWRKFINRMPVEPRKGYEQHKCFLLWHFVGLVFHSFPSTKKCYILMKYLSLKVFVHHVVRVFIKISACLMSSVSRNLIMMWCTSDERTTCSVIVLLIKHETCTTSLGEGPTSEIPTFIHSRLCNALFTLSAAKQ